MLTNITVLFAIKIIYFQIHCSKNSSVEYTGPYARYSQVTKESLFIPIEFNELPITLHCRLIVT